MKKYILSIAVIGTAAIAGWNYQQNQTNTELSDLALANVEALASGEGDSDCSRTCPRSGYMCIINFTDGSSISCPGRWP